MQLVKNSARTVRQACPQCGTREAYWALDKDTDRLYVVDKDSHTHNSKRGQSIPYATIHACFAASHPNGWSRDDHEPRPTPTTAPAVTTTDPRVAALETLLGNLIDAEKVRAIVQEVLSDHEFPTQTVVIREPHEPKLITALTHAKLARVLKQLGRNKPVMMVGPAGTGKSTIAEQAAEALDLSFENISMNPAMMPSQFQGYMNGDGGYVRTPFRDWFEHGNCLLHADEIDNSAPDILASLNAAIALRPGQYLTFPDGKVAKADRALFIGSANTYGTGPDRVYVGRCALDGATLDRFATIEVDYDLALEAAACHATGASPDHVGAILDYVRGLRTLAQAKRLPLIFGQRSSIYACIDAADGDDAESIVAENIRRGVSDTDWSSLGAPSLYL